VIELKMHGENMKLKFSRHLYSNIKGS